MVASMTYLPVEAGDVVRAREHDALDAVAARRFVEVVGADDVGLHDRLERAFDRDAAEVHDRIHPAEQREHRIRLLERRRHQLFAWPGGAEIGDVAEPQHRTMGLQTTPQLAAQAAGRARQEQAVEGWGGSSSRGHASGL